MIFLLVPKSLLRSRTKDESCPVSYILHTQLGTTASLPRAFIKGPGLALLSHPDASVGEAGEVEKQSLREVGRWLVHHRHTLEGDMRRVRVR